MHGETYRQEVEAKLTKALDDVSTPYLLFVVSQS